MRGRITMLLTAVYLLTGCSAKVVQHEPTYPDDTVYTRESAGIRLKDDFYGYMDFDLLYGTDIPSGMNGTGPLLLAQKRADDALSEEIALIGGSDRAYRKGSDEERIYKLYRQYLDTETRQKTGLAPLEKGLNAIDSAETAMDICRVSGMLYAEYGTAVLTAPVVRQDLYDSSRNRLYLGQMKLFYSADELLNGRDCAEDLQKRMKAILEALGHVDAAALAFDTVTMLLDIAECTADTSTMPPEECYNICSQAELGPLISEYLGAAGAGGRNMAVTDTVQLERICSLLTDENVLLWKALAECALFYAYFDYLPPEYDSLRNDRRTAEERAAEAVKKLLPEETGNIYAKRYRDDEVSAAVRSMTDDILSAYRKCIENSDRLSESDRALCLAKAENMTVNIGCPDGDERSIPPLSEDLLSSAVSIRGAAVRKDLAAPDSAAGGDEWQMPVYAVNAVYNEQRNSITVPMACFQSPLFDAEADYYTNLGALGFVIAHEIGHAFDAEGILYDENGNYRPTGISTERTELLSEEVAEYFGSRQIMGTFFIDGEHTKGENAADLGGMQVISSMADSREELMRIFESYAGMWATLSFDTDAAEQIAEDVHSPAEIRVNAVLSSLDRFYEAYDISETDGMYVPYDKRVRVW